MAVDRPATGFVNLTLDDWRQFDHVSIDFHPHLTILTGANASGKSTILSILGRHFSWSRAYSAALSSRRRGSPWTVLGRRRSKEVSADGSWAAVGSLTYASGVRTDITVPPVSGINRSQYDVALPVQQPVTGAFLTSHRAISGNYASISTIPTIFGTADQVFEQFTGELRNRWAGGWSGRSPQQALKEGLISAAVFGGGGNDAIETSIEASGIWHGFQAILREVVPTTLGFNALRVRVPEVIVETATGDFILDEASGGLSAIIEMSWQIFLRSRNHEQFTVLLDEPENHLHPSLQRDLIPGFLRAFPHVQFVIATHSPFVVTASPDSAVYALEYNDDSRVESRWLDYGNKAATADQTLKRVLGLQSTMPSWAVERFDAIVSEYLVGSVDEERLRSMREALRESGLESEFPRAIIRVVDAVSDGGIRE